MANPILDRDALAESLQIVAGEATRYAAPVRPPGPTEPADGLAGALPEQGAGSLAALQALIAAAGEAATRSAGPLFFHFVMGGGTHAALRRRERSLAAAFRSGTRNERKALGLPVAPGSTPSLLG